MLLVPKKTDSLKLHVINIAISYPKIVDANQTMDQVIGSDVKILAAKMVKALEERKTIGKLTISSQFATVEFIAITSESEWGAIVSSSVQPALQKQKYLVTHTDLNTGKDKSNKTYEVDELVYESGNVLCCTTYAMNFYRAGYMLELARNMESKNPASFVVLKKNFDDIGAIPYIASKLPEKFFGSLEESGFVFSNLLPFPAPGMGVELDIIPQSMNSFFNTYSTKELIKSILVDPTTLALDDAIGKLNNLNAAYFGGGDPILYLLPLTYEEFTMSEELLSHLTGRRQEFSWIFSQFSRFFEYNGVIETSKINTNLRFFQDQIKSLVNSPYTGSLYFEGSPRDLQDLIISWFSHSEYKKDLFYLLDSLDPSKSNFNLEYIRGDKDVLTKITPTYRNISPGLILMNNKLSAGIEVSESVTSGKLILSLSDKTGSSCVVQVVSVSEHDSDNNSIKSLIKIANANAYAEIRENLHSLLAFTMWLCNGDQSKTIAIDKNNGKYSIKWPAHVLRRYVKTSLFSGSLKLWLAS